MCYVNWLLFGVSVRTAAVSPRICNCGGMTGNTMKDTKFWDCIYEVLQVFAACKRSCGWKYRGKLRQLTSVIARVLWQHTLRSSREVSQENGNEKSGWGGPVVHRDATEFETHLRCVTVRLVHVARFGRNWVVFW